LETNTVTFAQKGFVKITLLTILSLSCSVPCLAQVDRSGLTGTVTDSSGRLLGQTHITAVENSTQSRREGVSDNAGRYDIPELPLGTYTITFDHPGFKTLTFLDVEQVVGRTRTLDAALQVSGAEERVEVSASSELIDRPGSLGHSDHPGYAD
jgi:hypothetical protein